MTRYFNFCLSPENPDVFEYIYEYRKKYSESLADKSAFRPVVESLNGLDAVRGAVEDGVFHFDDGKDDGRGLDTIPVRGEDIAVLYQRTRELEIELNQEISDAKRMKQIRDSIRSDSANTSANTSSTPSAGTSEPAK